MKSGLDASAEGGEGLRCVGPSCFQVEPSTACRAQGRKVQDALAVGFLAVEMNPHIGPELLGHADELGGHPEVEAQGVGDCHPPVHARHGRRPPSRLAASEALGAMTSMSLTTAVIPSILATVCG